MRFRPWTRHELARALFSGLVAAGLGWFFSDWPGLGLVVAAVSLLGYWHPSPTDSGRAQFSSLLLSACVALALLVVLECQEVYLKVLREHGMLAAWEDSFAHYQRLVGRDSPHWALAIALAGGVALGDVGHRHAMAGGTTYYRPSLLGPVAALSGLVAAVVFISGTYAAEHPWEVRTGIFLGLATLATLVAIVVSWGGLLVFALGADVSVKLLGPPPSTQEDDGRAEPSDFPGSDE